MLKVDVNRYLSGIIKKISGGFKICPLNQHFSAGNPIKSR